MTMMTLEQRIDKEEDTLKALWDEVQELRDEVKTYRKAIKGAYAEDTELKSPDVKCLSALVKQCLEAERSLAKCYSEKAGIGACGYALDLDAVKTSLGSKLDKLRAAGEANGVS